MTENEKINYGLWLKQFGKIVSASRKRQGLTQRQAAKKTGFVLKFYQDIEYGRRPITTRTLFQLVERLDLPIPYFQSIIVLCG
jgi:transcriptional regulator with XRE-family HTH domain